MCRPANEALVVAWHLNKLLEDDAIVSVDSGTITTWAARYIQMRGSMKFSVSGSAGQHGDCPALQYRGRDLPTPGRSGASALSTATAD